MTKQAATKKLRVGIIGAGRAGIALGAGDDVVGVTFECDHPPEARSRRIVSTSAMPEGLGPAEIDAFVAAALARGDDLYHLDEGALSSLSADLVATQDLCAVCAVDVSPEAIAQVRSLARTLALHLPGENFRQEPVERMSFEGESFDAVLSSAVLHFAQDDDQCVRSGLRLATNVSRQGLPAFEHDSLAQILNLLVRRIGRR